MSPLIAIGTVIEIDDSNLHGLAKRPPFKALLTNVRLTGNEWYCTYQPTREFSHVCSWGTVLLKPIVVQTTPYGRLVKIVGRVSIPDAPKT